MIQQLKDKFELAGHSNCPSGWIPLVFNLIESVLKIDPNARFIFIRSECGQLEICISSTHPQVKELVSKTELQATQTCEICGSTDNIIRASNYSIICNKCLNFSTQL